MNRTGIIFDIDDTLMTHSQAEYEASIKFGNLYSEKITDYQNDTFPSLWKEISNTYFKKFLEGKLSFKDQQIERIREIFNQKKMSENEAYDCFKTYLKLYEESWQLFKDVVPILEKCQKMGIPLGIITDGSKKQQTRKLINTGIVQYFIFIITAEEMNCSKPDPCLFKKGIDSFSEEIRQIYYIGDNLKKDAIGSMESGLIGIWLNRDQKKGSFPRMITSLDELSVSSL